MAQLEREFNKNRKDMMTNLERCRLDCLAHGLQEAAEALGDVLATMRGLETPAQFLGWVGGTTPVKPGSRRRGRPRKVA